MRRVAILGALLALTGVAGGCGGSDDGAGEDQAAALSTAPVEVDTTTGPAPDAAAGTATFDEAYLFGTGVVVAASRPVGYEPADPSYWDTSEVPMVSRVTITNGTAGPLEITSMLIVLGDTDGAAGVLTDQTNEVGSLPSEALAAGESVTLLVGGTYPDQARADAATVWVNLDDDATERVVFGG